MYNARRPKRRALVALGLTEKRPVAGHNVSHALNRTKRLFKPNLQKTTVVVDGKRVTVRLDAKTIRSLTKTQKDRKPVAPKRQPTKLQAKKGKPAKKAAPKATKKPAAKPVAKKSPKK